MAMPTYEEIRDYVEEKCGYRPKDCWIADLKEQCGLSVEEAPNRIDPNERQEPCPEDKKECMKAAFKDLGMI